jgi:xanthine dehydrogenase large subunit
VPAVGGRLLQDAEDHTGTATRRNGRPFYYFAYGAACSEVTIDTLTGEMRVDRVDILHDVGKSLNPAIDIGQIEGGFVQGMGWLTTEELVWDEKGGCAPCALDLQDPDRLGRAGRFPRRALFESGGNREETIYRSKAVGEPPLMLALVGVIRRSGRASHEPGLAARSSKALDRHGASRW